MKLREHVLGVWFFLTHSAFTVYSHQAQANLYIHKSQYLNPTDKHVSRDNTTTHRQTHKKKQNINNHMFTCNENSKLH